MVSKEDIKNLAELARLELSDTEVAALQKDISHILDYVGQVSAVVTHELPDVPLHRNRMRDDTPRDIGHPLANKEELLRKAFPKEEGGYNAVRKIIQKDE